MNNNYPFRTKNDIKAQIESDDAFVLTCLVIMDDRQTEDERDTRETKWRNKMGWMSSHAVNGGKLATLVRNGEELDAEQLDKARGMVSKYSKQLASHFRQAAKDENPELAEAGSTFGV
jgi:hypothetical protein